MINVGIDVAKNKHECCIVDGYGEVLENSFTITNNKEGYEKLLSKINNHVSDNKRVKVGLEATGHYTDNLLHFLYKKGYCIYLINPLQTDLYRKAMSLRKTKTDKIDAINIAKILLSGIDLKPYTQKSYQTFALKQLTRCRFATIHDRSRQKVKFVKLVDMIFPELEEIVNDINCNTVYELLSRYPSAEKISRAHINTLYELMRRASKNRMSYEKICKIHNVAKESVGSSSVAISLELEQVISIIKLYNIQIKKLDSQIQETLNKTNTQIMSIPGIGPTTGASIIAEIGDITLFSNADKIQAFAGISPSTYQSGKLDNSGSHMEKRGSKFLRYSILTAARCVVMWDQKFKDYMDKKISEGKHYFVALSHVAKKLIRVIFALEMKGEAYKIF